MVPAEPPPSTEQNTAVPGDRIEIGDVQEAEGIAVGRSAQAFRTGDVHAPIVQAQGGVGDVISAEVVTIYQREERAAVSNRQALPPPDTYVARVQVETRLRELLTACPGKLNLAGLNGLPGVGKTAVGRKVAQDLEAEFPDGTLWADLEAMTKNDIVASFIEPFAPSFDRSSMRTGGQYLNYLQSVIGDKRVLMVLDQAKAESPLAELLPRDCPNVTALVISTAPVPVVPAENRVHLPEMSPEEAVRLFLNLWKGMVVFRDAQGIRELAEQLSFIPAVITVVARDIMTGQMSPEEYLNDLRRRRQTGGGGAPVTNPGLEAVFKNLPYHARQLLPFLGVLGEGIWTLDALANVSRLQGDAVLTGVNQLLSAQLLVRVSQGRFQSGAMVRDYALEKLNAGGGDALIRASRALVGHYYLVHNQQVLARARQKLLAEFLADGGRKQEFLQALQDSFVPAENGSDDPVKSLTTVDPNLGSPDLTADVFEKVVLRNPEFFERFSQLLSAQALADSKPHLIDALNWALEQEDWGLVRRYASLTSERILFPFGVSGPGKTDVAMALDFSLFRDWSLQNVNLTSSLRACRLVNGTAQNCEFIATNWSGVRLERPVLQNVDMVGARAPGTVFMNGVFERVDLRNADLRGSIFYDCMFEGVNFRFANLDRVEFIRTTMANVDFRGTRFQVFDARDAEAETVLGRIIPGDFYADTVPYE